MSDLKSKGEQWRDRIFKMIMFFGLLGMIALVIAVTMISNTFKEILAPAVPASGSTTSAGK